MIEKLQENDYYNGYLDILEQLTIVNKDSITFNKFKNQLNNMKSNIYVIKNSDLQIFGCGSILIEEKFIHGCSKVAHIEDIVVDYKYRGNGYGKMIIDYLVDIAIKENCYKVILNCNSKNKQFYEKCGFISKEIQMQKKLM